MPRDRRAPAPASPGAVGAAPGVVVDQVDDAAHHDPHGLRVAPGLTRAIAHRLDRRAEVGEVLPAAADPALGEPPGAAQCRRSGAAQQHRGVRSLHGRRAHVRTRHGVELAGELDGVLRPQRLQAAQVLVHSLASPLVGHAGGGVLLRQPAHPETRGEPAAGQHVQRRQRLREQRGSRERRADGRRPQTDPVGVPRDVRKRDDRVEHRLGATGRARRRRGRARAGRSTATRTRAPRRGGRCDESCPGWPSAPTPEGRTRAGEGHPSRDSSLPWRNRSRGKARKRGPFRRDRVCHGRSGAE